MCRCRGIIHISAHLARSWLAVGIADLTPDLQVLLSLGLAVVSFNSQQHFSVRFFHVIVGLPCCHQPVYTCCSSCSKRTLPVQSSKAFCLSKCVHGPQAQVLPVALLIYCCHILCFDTADMSKHDPVVEPLQMTKLLLLWSITRCTQALYT